MNPNFSPVAYGAALGRAIERAFEADKKRAAIEAENVRRCEAYLAKCAAEKKAAAALKASAPCPAPGPVAGNTPKVPAKPKPVKQAPGHQAGKPPRWMTLYEVQNTNKAVADAILKKQIDPPKELRDFGDFRLFVWDFDAAVALAAQLPPPMAGLPKTPAPAPKSTTMKQAPGRISLISSRNM